MVFFINNLSLAVNYLRYDSLVQLEFLLIAEYTVSTGCTMYDVWRTSYDVRCTTYDIQYTMYAVHCTVYDIWYTAYIVRRTINYVRCTMYDVRYTIYDAIRTITYLRCTSNTTQRRTYVESQSQPICWL